MMRKSVIYHCTIGLGYLVFFGLLSVYLGQDTSWDTRNYHVYNPYAFLTDRLAFDLAPAQLQSYFSPVIDLPVYWLSKYLHPWFVGFWVGGVQGLNALLVFLIGRELLAADRKAPVWIPLSLATLGCMNASFITQLGTAAGDSSSSLFVLWALFLICSKYTFLIDDSEKSRRLLISVGLLMGIAIGLKLTNIPFALAMAIVLAFLPGRVVKRLKQNLIYGFSLIFSFLLISGWWFYKIWTIFGNPLFPQFNSFFKGELASATSVIDTRWGPVNMLEAISWPFWMSFRPWRIHDAPLYNHLWVLFYFVLIAWLVGFICRFIFKKKYLFLNRVSSIKFSKPIAALPLFIFFSYLIWLKVFSIGRYLTALEVLLPILIYLGIKNFIYPRLAFFLTLILCLVSLAIGFKQSNFGIRAAWAEQDYSVALPPLHDSSSATILIAAAGEPNSWLLRDFPMQTAVLRISGNFPRSPAYDNYIRRTLVARGGHVYVILPSPTDWSLIRAEQLNHKLAFSELMQKPTVCKIVGMVAANLGRYENITIATNTNGSCQAQVKEAALPMAEKGGHYLVEADAQLVVLGYKLVTDSCRTYQAHIGKMSLPYQFCDAIRFLDELPGDSVKSDLHVK